MKDNKQLVYLMYYTFPRRNKRRLLQIFIMEIVIKREHSCD